jgi:hypothetical protein
MDEHAGKIFNEATGQWEWASEAPMAQDASLGLTVRERVAADREKTQAIRAAQQADPEGIKGVGETGDEPLSQRIDAYVQSGGEELAKALIEDVREHEAHGATVSEGGAMAQFSTGATRNRKENELRYDGFLSPLALQMFARYMHKNRKTADGTMREPDNWQKGMPDASYLDSLLRHVMDIWLIYRGYPEAAREGKFEALSGAFFNIQGLMHNWMTEDVSLEEVLATLAATGTLETPDGDA